MKLPILIKTDWLSVSAWRQQGNELCSHKDASRDLQHLT